jgi:tetratricopeptide (TPR) repeat protein
VALEPDFAQAHFNLGLAHQSRGQTDLALSSYTQAIHCKPDYALALRHLGTLLQTQARYDEAIECHRKALALNPGDAEAHCNLASALKDQGRASEAIESYHRALAVQPDLAEAHFNLGVIYQGQERLEDAAESYRSAIRARSDYAAAHSNLGTVYKFQGNLSEAMRCYEAGLRSRDDLAEAHRNRALLRLLLGDFAAGWPEYEWRFRVPGARPHGFDQPRWNGEPLDGGTVLVVAEQGLGDTIQFVRFAPLVKQRCGGQVLLQCPAALVELLKDVEGIDGFVTGEAAKQSFDRFVPMLSLPAVLGTTLDTIPSAVPYLSPQPARVEHWRRELARFSGFKVGIAWQGNPAYVADAQRSVPLAHFAPLADCPGVRLVSLQKHHGLKQLPPLAERLRIVNLGPLVDNASAAFVDTAAVMKNLDLVITSDSAIAHLAGALGVPVWVALPAVPDWRWLLARQDSPWYPTMRLFRQSRAGDWGGVFARIADELRALAASRPGTSATGQTAIADALEAAERLRQQGKLDEAQRNCRELIALAPDGVDPPPRPRDLALAHNTLGKILEARGDAGAAADCFRRAVDLADDLVDAHFNLGCVLQSQGRWDDAIAGYRRAVELDPNYAPAFNNLGVALKQEGRFDQAMAALDAGIRANPDLGETHRNRALLRLLLGDLAEGWTEFEWRWQVPPPAVERPRWDGRPAPGSTLLLVGEQGLGDIIQFVRYAPLVKDRWQGRVLLRCPSSLWGLLQGAAGIDGFLQSPEEASYDAYVPLMSLPLVFGVSSDAIPRSVPYLAADPKRQADWRQRLAAYEGFRVGIAWQGNPKFVGEPRRSPPLREFAPLAECPGVRLISLQKHHGGEQLRPLAKRLRIVNLEKSLDLGNDAFVDTAAIMKSLDLVITSDTAVAHLAGALGVRVWVALPLVPDWRWMLARQDSPWYPTMRLFRQSRAGDWGEVFARMAGELRLLVTPAAGPSALPPAPRVEQNSAQSHFVQGARLQAEGKLDEAIASYRRAVALDPTDAMAHSNLGVALRQQGYLDEAVVSFQRAIECKPLLPQLHYNLANAYSKQHKLDLAEPCFRRAIELGQEGFEPYNNLGSLLQAQGRLDEARVMFDAALARKPSSFEAHCNRAFLRLLTGDFAEGWPEYEWRLQVPDQTVPNFSQPPWQGQAAARRTILLWSEQGLGDAIQFVRYAKLAKGRSKARIILRCAPTLHRLLRTAPGVDRCVADELDRGPFDYHAALMSLPAICGTTLYSIPADVPYLSAEPERIERWRRELNSLAAFKVGIAWQGKPTYSQDASRSIPLAEFAPLAECAGVRLVSLQKGHGRQQLPPLAERLRIVDLGASLDEGADAFVDTAAVMKNLDLVITSDTSIAHLAGALGVKVWVALAQIPDWRWLMARQDSPWYPTMRLFRQSRSGDWGEVFARIAAALASLSSEAPKG